MPRDTGRAMDPEAGRRRTRHIKTGVAVASAAMFVVAVPAVQGTEHGHARPAHALKPPSAFVDALAQGGFGAGELAPSQAAPVAQSGGS
jgi:hypothetical protein